MSIQQNRSLLITGHLKQEATNRPYGFLGFGIFSLLLLCLITIFYDQYYSIHQDVAGAALSGALAMALGNAYDTYSLYFPPMERAWFSFAVLLQQLTGVRLDLIVICMTSVAIIFSSGLAYLIRMKSVGATPLFLIISTLFITVFPILFKNVFGVREHLVVLGLWPYIVLRVSDPGCRKIGMHLRFAVGLWLGFTLCFKYLYAIVVLLVEFSDAYAQRRWSCLFRMENLISGFCIFLYLLFWLGLSPENLQAIAIMKSAIAANLKTPLQLIKTAAPFLLLVLIIITLCVLNKAPKREILLGASIVTGSIIVALVQQRFYTHHVYPVYLSFFVWIWILKNSFSMISKLIFCLFLTYSVFVQFQETKSTAALTSSLQSSGIDIKGQRIALLTLHPSPFNQVIAKSGALRWSPFVNLAYIPAELMPYDLEASAGKLAKPIHFLNTDRAALHGQMLQLWEDYPPDAIILDNSSNWPLRYIELDWQSLLSEDKRFNAILDNYNLVTSYNDKGLNYQYYVKK